MGKTKINLDKYASLARQACAEGCVLVRNEEEVLPLKSGQKVSVFGRIQFDYYKSGTGSGGLVNAKYVVGILDALKNCGSISLNTELISIYEQWLKENPFEYGFGWAQEPWSQKEMPLSNELVDNAARKSDIAIVVIGRTAGEDKDNSYTPGSYLLTDSERNMLSLVCSKFQKVVVVLNVGNVIDMNWVNEYKPQAVVYAWHGGMEGGNGIVDVLTGRVNPCGRLTDTIIYDVMSSPSMQDFGNENEIIYKEDIYVGYRYFETTAKDKVMYPFGYGLSYTSFAHKLLEFDASCDMVNLKVEVTNIGDLLGKEVVQVYSNSPVGALGKPARELEAFGKTVSLKPGEKEILKFSFAKNQLASYDDSGITGNKSCYVLEKGEYKIYTGANVREAKLVGSFKLDELVITESLTEACAPVKAFKRFIAAENGEMQEEAVPTRTIDLEKRILNELPKAIAITGDRGIKLKDVVDNKASMEDFIAQLSEEDLACIVRGEGMCSSRVTPGTAAAFGGVSDRLYSLGIPAACCADGPSGIRMDCGTNAFSLPNGTSLASTFNIELVEQLFDMVGEELYSKHVDTLLGPGMNIHRTPLNGRNFEYFSEDPLLTGKMAAAQLKGMNKHKVTGTVKHFACNNQEFHRHDVSSVVSERALREIYLKGYEIAIKEGGLLTIMTSYGAINGIWSAGNYDLNTTILRNEWGFKGLVMTDWWAKINEEDKAATRDNTSSMIKAQNDIYMVCNDPSNNSSNDNTIEGLRSGKISLGQLQRNAANICSVIGKLAAMDRLMNTYEEEEETEQYDDIPEFSMKYYDIDSSNSIALTDINTTKGTSTTIGVSSKVKGLFKLAIRLKASGGELAQVPVSIFVNNTLIGTITVNGTEQWQEIEKDCLLFNKNSYIKLYFAQGGMKLDKMTFKLSKDISELMKF